MLKIKMLPLGPLQTNCFLVACDETHEVAIVDPAWDGEVILDAIHEEGWHLKKVLLTHSHFDHVGGLSAVKAATNTPVVAHAETIPMLQFAAASASRWGLNIEQPADPDELVNEGQTITVGNITFEVLDTPGHAPGHISFYAAQAGAVFDGDVLFEGSIGRTDLPGGDYATLITSIRQKLLTLPDNTQVFPGHGNPTTIGQERRTNPFLQDLL